MNIQKFIKKHQLTDAAQGDLVLLLKKTIIQQTHYIWKSSKVMKFDGEKWEIGDSFIDERGVYYVEPNSILKANKDLMDSIDKF